MPTGGTADSDFTVLANACRTDGYTERDINPSPVSSEPTSKGVYYLTLGGSTVKKGLYFVGGDGNKLFFPATGYGSGKTLTSVM